MQKVTFSRIYIQECLPVKRCAQLSLFVPRPAEFFFFSSSSSAIVILLSILGTVAGDVGKLKEGISMGGVRRDGRWQRLTSWSAVTLGARAVQSITVPVVRQPPTEPCFDA